MEQTHRMATKGAGEGGSKGRKNNKLGSELSVPRHNNRTTIYIICLHQGFQCDSNYTAPQPRRFKVPHREVLHMCVISVGPQTPLTLGTLALTVAIGWPD